MTGDLLLYTDIDRYITTAKALKICEVCRMNGAFPRHVSTSLYFHIFSEVHLRIHKTKPIVFHAKH